MRILYFSRDYTTHDHRFLSALSQTEHRVFYLRLEGGRQTLEERPLPPEIEQVEWAGGQSPASWRVGPRLLNDLRRVLKTVKPDLVHAGPIQRCAFLVALTGFHPLVSVSWGYDLLHDARINSLWSWATRYTLRRSDSFVGDCNTIRQLAISYGMSNERIVTFPWGVDLSHFNVQTLERSKIPTFNLLSTRGWEPIYGIDVIARAFVIAAKKRPELRLTLMGSGSLADTIHQILLIDTVYDKVIFPGQVPYADLPSYYHNTDVCIGASHSDGTSISMLEAFACGKPVIVPDIPGNREWVTSGNNGWLFPDGNAEALAFTILTAMDKRQDLAEMGRKARLLAEERADWNKNFPVLEKAYEIALRK